MSQRIVFHGAYSMKITQAEPRLLTIILIDIDIGGSKAHTG